MKLGVGKDNVGLSLGRGGTSPRHPVGKAREKEKFAGSDLQKERGKKLRYAESYLLWGKTKGRAPGLKEQRINGESNRRELNGTLAKESEKTLLEAIKRRSEKRRKWKTGRKKRVQAAL